LGTSLAAVQAALRRLKRRGEIADPYRGFHVIVPPEYRRLGCLPAEQFVPQLMRVLGETYYVALLSAAELHGAAHQRPQAFQGRGAPDRSLEAHRQRQHRGGPVIPKDFITEWREQAPWVTDRQVEQDLVISRALVELFSSEPIASTLAFRGGTALYKLHLKPAA